MATYAFTDEEAEVLSHKPRLGELSVGEKVAEADLLKQQGNLYFKAGMFKKAVQQYLKIFLYVNGLSVAGDGMSSYARGNSKATEDEGVAITQLKIAAYSNMAMCQLKLDNPDKAIELADKVLALEPGHTKARLRKAQAYRQKGKFTVARDVLREALVAEPKNAALRSELKQVLDEIQLHPEVDEMKAKMANIFNKSGGIYK